MLAGMALFMPGNFTGVIGMNWKEKYKDDIEAIMAMRHHLGGDYWTTEDNRIGKSLTNPIELSQILIYENQSLS